MKILKLLNKKNFLFIIFLIFFSNSIANEPADIWNIDKSQTEPQEDTITENIISDELSEEKISVYDLNSQEEDCTEIYSTGKWNDRPCENYGNRHYFICNYPCPTGSLGCIRNW